MHMNHPRWDWCSSWLQLFLSPSWINHPFHLLSFRASSFSLDEKEWDNSSATYDLIRHVANAVDEVEIFKKLADPWRKKSKRIQNMNDLFRRQHADISGVRIPRDDCNLMANEHINKAHHQIVQTRDDSFRAKINAHMLLNSIWLTATFKLGSTYLVTVKNVSIPRDFGDHVLRMAFSVERVTGIHNCQELFHKPSRM